MSHDLSVAEDAVLLREYVGILPSLAAREMARQLIVEQAELAESDDCAIEIISRDRLGRGIRPRVLIAGRPVPWCLSISHTETAALVALCTAAEVAMGVDLVKIEPLGSGFGRAWFDADERELAAGEDPNHPLETCCLWAAKEAAYKAINSGDSFAPRQIRVRKLADGSYTCIYRGVDLSSRCSIDTWLSTDHVAALAILSPQNPSTALIPNP